MAASGCACPPPAARHMPTAILVSAQPPQRTWRVSKSPTKPRTALSGRSQVARKPRTSSAVMPWICGRRRGGWAAAAAAAWVGWLEQAPTCAVRQSGRAHLRSTAGRWGAPQRSPGPAGRRPGPRLLRRGLACKHRVPSINQFLQLPRGDGGGVVVPVLQSVEHLGRVRSVRDWVASGDGVG